MHLAAAVDEVKQNLMLLEILREANFLAAKAAQHLSDFLTRLDAGGRTRIRHTLGHALGDGAALCCLCSRYAATLGGVMMSRATRSRPRRCDNRTVVEANVHSVPTSTCSPLIICASISSLCTVTAARRLNKPILMSEQFAAPPMSTRKPLTKSRKRRAAFVEPLTPSNRSLWLVTRGRPLRWRTSRGVATTGEPLSG